MIFCDTSTLAKYYVTESESAAVRARLDAEDGVVVSELARVELMGVFHRRWRERKWAGNDFLAVIRQFNKDDVAGYWSWARLDGAVLEPAAQTYATLPDTVFLRSSDCLHLVTALHHGFGEIYTHDRHQAAAAPVLGLKPITVI